MSEIQKKEGDHGIVHSPEAKAIQAPDAQAARNAGVSDLKAAQAQNRDAHSGSAGGDQNESIEIIAFKDSGKYDLVTSRQKPQGRPEELPAKAQVPKNEEAKPDGKKQVEPLTVDFLREKAKQGDIWAKSFVSEIATVERLPAGPTRDLHLQQVLKKAEHIFRPGERRAPEQIPENQNDTGTIIAVRAEKNQAVEVVKAHHDWTTKLEPGPERDKHKQLAREQLVQLEPQAKEDLERLDRKRKLLAEQEHAGTHDIRELQKRQLEGHVEYPENPWQAFTRLRPDQQREIVKAFEKAGQVGQEGYEQKIQAVAESVPKAFYNVGKSLYDTGIVAGTFLIESAQRPEKVPETAKKLADSLAEAIAGGAKISLFVAVQAQEMAQTGDYSPAVEGLKTIAEAANERWEAMPLEKRTEKGSELIAEMGIGSVVGGADRLAKSGKLIDALEDIAKHLKDLSAPGRDKAKQAIGAFLDDIFQPKGLTTNGFEMPIPKPPRDIDDLVMLKNKGLPDSVRPSEKMTTKRHYEAATDEIIHHLKVSEEVFKAAEKRGLSRDVVQEKFDKISVGLSQVYARLGDYKPNVHGSERAYGIKFHELLRQRLGSDDFIHTEASYRKGSPVSWGKLGSSRVDIALGEHEKPFASMCLKTLEAVPSAQQERGWYRNLPRFDDESIIPRIYFKLGK